MAKVTVCDVCKTRHDALRRASQYMHVKGHKDLRIDLCHMHSFELENKFPKVTVEYVQFVYEMVRGTKLTLEDAQLILRESRR